MLSAYEVNTSKLCETPLWKLTVNNINNYCPDICDCSVVSIEAILSFEFNICKFWIALFYYDVIDIQKYNFGRLLFFVGKIFLWVKLIKQKMT